MNPAREYESESLERRVKFAASVIVLFGFFARVWAASGTFLNPDEALHYRLANQVSLALAYKESLTSLHPPLLILLLHLWRMFGTSECWLRLPSAIAGSVFCWLFYKWLGNAAGELAGLIGLMLVAWLPPQIILSAEVRQYPLLLAFLAAALYFLDRAFAEESPALMLASVIALYLAMLTHYSAFLFAAALGLYGLSKIVSEPRRSRVIATWVLGQTGGILLCFLLYKTHLSRHDFGKTQILQGWMNYLERSFYLPGRDNPILFAIGHSFGVFQFLFGQLAVGIAMGVAYLVGLLMLLRRQNLIESAAANRRLAILLLVPFVLTCATSFLHVYPYGGTRHIAFLIIPGVAGISVALACIARSGSARANSARTDSARASLASTSPRSLATGLALAGLILIACFAFGKPRQPWMVRSDQSRVHMMDALDFIKKNIEPGDLIFTDYQSDLLLGHYLCQQRTIVFEVAPAGFEQFSCAGHRVISEDFRGWQFAAESFPQQWRSFLQAYNVKPDTAVWIFHAGWGANLPEDLRREPQYHDLHFESFGNNIKIFKLAVPR